MNKEVVSGSKRASQVRSFPSQTQKKAQVTIFIIVAVIMIGAIGAYFALRESSTFPIGGKTDENPEAFLNSCIKDKVREAINFLSLQGGYANPNVYRNFSFSGEPYRKITYLCYNQNSYSECVNQKPFFYYDLKKEIKSYISSDVKGCFDDMVESLERENEVFVDYRDFKVEVLPKRVIILTDSKLTVTSSGETKNYEDLEVLIPSRLYEISVLVQEIVNQEAEYCYAESHGIEITYAEDFEIDKYWDSQAYTNIYTIVHKDSQEKFRFAIRGCVILPNLGISTNGTEVSGLNNNQNYNTLQGIDLSGYGNQNFD